MKKDKEWLKEELMGLNFSINEFGKVRLGEIFELVDQLDEPEQTDTNVGLSKVVIPQFVANYIEKWKDGGLAIPEWFTFDYDDEEDDEVSKWLYNNTIGENTRREYLLIDAIRYGYEVEKEPVYYAKIKGHELVETEAVLDDDTGNDISEFHRNIYFVLQRNGELVIDMKDSGLSGAKHFMTMSQWNNLGINDGNADFEEVTE